eukprot:m.483970 g.483970  ORF g.483970 m.483970 type:complete len:70 (-) comp67535_c0_seq1:235-444(-)
MLRQRPQKDDIGTNGQEDGGDPTVRGWQGCNGTTLLIPPHRASPSSQTAKEDGGNLTTQRAIGDWSRCE